MSPVTAPSGDSGLVLREVSIKMSSSWRVRLRNYPRQLQKHLARHLVAFFLPAAATLYGRLTPTLFEDYGGVVYTPLGFAIALQLVLLADILFIQRAPTRELRFTPDEIITTAHGLPVRHAWSHVLQVDDREKSLDVLLDEDGLRQVLVLPKSALPPDVLTSLRLLFAYNRIEIGGSQSRLGP